MEALKRTAKREDILPRAAAATTSLGMWRYASVLPDVTPVTLGEGWTPLLQSKRYPGLYIKEEGANPTGTFKARGLGLAVTMAKHYGLKHLAVPSAGNAAGALAAYAAAAGIAAHIFMPKDVPFANYLEGIIYGADVTMVDGLISDCARMVGERIEAQREANTPAAEIWFDISTLKEPFRVEGKKTMGYELVEQLGWTYPLLCRSEANVPVRLLVLHPESRVQFDIDSQHLAHEAKVNPKLWQKFWQHKELFHGVKYAYALTAHRSQGSTYQSVWVDYQDILLNRSRKEAFQCLYVACSRPTTQLILA